MEKCHIEPASVFKGANEITITMLPSCSGAKGEHSALCTKSCTMVFVSAEDRDVVGLNMLVEGGKVAIVIWSF